jgi:hypothetical protein
MKWLNIIVVLVLVGCNTTIVPEVEEQVYGIDSIIVSEFKSDTIKFDMDRMLSIISYVDSANVVEKHVEKVAKLKEENEKLEIMVEEADIVIRKINTELKEVREVVRSITADSSITPFELLPVQ